MLENGRGAARRSKKRNFKPGAYLTSFLAEFSDFDGDVRPVHLQQRGSPPFRGALSSPAPVSSLLVGRFLRVSPGGPADVRVGVNVDRARVNRASYNIRVGPARATR